MIDAVRDKVLAGERLGRDEGRWLLTLTAHVDHGAIAALYIVVNPDKLAALDIADPML